MNRSVWAALAVVGAIGITAGCGDKNTVTSPLPVGTPVPGMPTATPVPSAHTATVDVGQGGMNFVDQASGGATTTIHSGDTVRWVWVGGFHSTTSGGCSGSACTSSGLWDSGAGSGMTFSRTFAQAGSFPYHCSVHGSLMQGTVVVQ